jgi:hypothetical protein
MVSAATIAFTMASSVASAVARKKGLNPSFAVPRPFVRRGKGQEDVSGSITPIPTHATNADGDAPGKPLQLMG